jgi:hypothetical protein
MQLKRHLAIGLIASSVALFAHSSAFAPAVVIQSGVALGGMHGSVSSKQGQMRGRVVDSNGIAYRIDATVDPGPVPPGQWTGFTPVGPIKGHLTSLSGTPIANQIDVLGTYHMEPGGTGGFSLVLYRPQTSVADPGQALGTMTGTFSGANTINPYLLLPEFGPFQATWQMEL